MKPQPPVTRIRTATASSAQASALADFPILGPQIELWKNALVESQWTPWLIIGLAAFLRFFLLGMKPPHFDEGINGWFVDQLVKTGYYKYDPTNYHGPLHFYVLLLSQTLFGRNLWALRLPVVLVSIASVWLTLKFEPFVGRTISRLAALAMAVSPGFVFYGRYSIHEVWLLLFTILFFYGVFGLWKSGTANFLWCAGMGLTGMMLSKETYMLHVGCAIIAAGVCYASTFFFKLDDAKRAPQTWTYLDLAVVIGTSIALIVAFYSGFFLHWSGVRDLFKAYAPWFKTGSEGHGHEKSWYYWLALTSHYELPALAGLLFCILAWRFKNLSLRYLAIYGVGTFMAYSIVKYKTPWCIISFIWPFLFTFGAMVATAPLRFKRNTYLFLALGLLGLLGYAAFYASTNKWPATWHDMWPYWLIASAPVLLMLISVDVVTHRWLAVGLIGLLGYGVYYAMTNKIPATWDHTWPYWLIGGAGALLVVITSREIAGVMAALLVLWSLGHCIRLNYFRCTTDTEPYVYVQTYNDIYKFTNPLLELAHADPRGYQMVGHIIRPSPYPLPWILGDFGRVGYYEKDNSPDKLDADFLLVMQDKIKTVESKLHDSYYTVPVTIRPYQDPSKAYFSAKIFKTFFPGQWPDFTGAPPAASPAPSAPAAANAPASPTTSPSAKK